MPTSSTDEVRHDPGAAESRGPGQEGRFVVDWGHLALVIGLLALTLLYLADAVRASSRVGNLLLVLPASIVSCVLALIVLAGILRDAKLGRTQLPGESAGPPLLILGLFALYILSIPALGMDVGSALFAAAAMICQGERDPRLLIMVPILTAAGATLLFKWLMPYPMPTLLF